MRSGDGVSGEDVYLDTPAHSLSIVIGRHHIPASWRKRYTSNSNSVGAAVSLKLADSEPLHKCCQSLIYLILIDAGKGGIGKARDLFGRKAAADIVVEEEVVEIVFSKGSFR